MVIRPNPQSSVFVAVLAVAAVLPAFFGSAMAADNTVATPPAEPQATTAASEARPSRLKFKRGPVCLCSSGTSEQDIQNAAKRFSRIDTSPEKPLN